MPEGDAVFRLGRQLDERLSGQVLLASDFRVPQHATADLSGAEVLETATVGKHLLTRFRTAEGRAVTLHTHLKMEGWWRFYLPGGRWGRPVHEARVVLRTETTEAVGFALGIVELVATDAEHTILGHLGPDLLDPHFDLDEAVRRARADPERRIGEVLLDQTCLAGLGTVYRAETLYVAGLHPRLPVDRVRDLRRLLRRSQQMLAANATRTMRSTTGDTRRGRDLWVYGRDGQPCRRCRTKIRHEHFGPLGQERISYWCPTCQPAPDDLATPD